MAGWEDVRRIALTLLPSWRVKGKAFAWERPLRRADREALGPVRPERIGLPELTELLTEAWLARAPKRLAKANLETG
jgi:hypothetical protein